MTHSTECRYGECHFAECRGAHRIQWLSEWMYIVFNLYKPWTLFKTPHILNNLLMGPIIYSVTLHRAGKACRRQTV